MAGTSQPPLHVDHGGLLGQEQLTLHGEPSNPETPPKNEFASVLQNINHQYPIIFCMEHRQPQAPANMARPRTGNVNTRDAAVARIRALWPEIPASSVPPIEREIDALLNARVHRQTFCSIPPVRNIRSSLERALSLKATGSRGWQSQLPARDTVLAALCVAEDGQLGTSIGQLLKALGAHYLTVPRCRAPSPLPEEAEMESSNGTPGVMTPGSTPRNSVDPPANQAPPAGAAPPSIDPYGIQHVRMNGATVRGYVNRAVPLPNLPANAPPYEQLEVVTEYLDERVEAFGDAAVAMHNVLVEAAHDRLWSMRRDHARAILALRDEYQEKIARAVRTVREECQAEIVRVVEDVREEFRARDVQYNGSMANGEPVSKDSDSLSVDHGPEGSQGYWEAMLVGGNEALAYGDVLDPALHTGVDFGPERVNEAFLTSTGVMLTEPMVVNSNLEEPPPPSGSCGYSPRGLSPP